MERGEKLSAFEIKTEQMNVQPKYCRRRTSAVHEMQGEEMVPGLGKWHVSRSRAGQISVLHSEILNFGFSFLDLLVKNYRIVS